MGEWKRQLIFPHTRKLTLLESLLMHVDPFEPRLCGGLAKPLVSPRALGTPHFTIAFYQCGYRYVSKRIEIKFDIEIRNGNSAWALNFSEGASKISGVFQ